jgi:hypothetical protein
MVIARPAGKIYDVDSVDSAYLNRSAAEMIVGAKKWEFVELKMDGRNSM